MPTLSNGGVSEDGLTITYNPRTGVVWSDGDPFDCDDVVFTYDAIVHPESGAQSTSGYADMESVTCSDSHSVVVQYGVFYAPYLSRFGVILPSHAGLDIAAQSEWEYNRMPNPVLGPFIMEEWVSGDHATLVRNENYEFWASDGLPYLDAVILRVVESREVGKQLLISGEVDFVWDLSEADLPIMGDIDGIRLNSVPSASTERLVLNWRNPEMDALTPTALRQDPMWHWALGDVLVRRAIQHGIDKQLIIDNLLYGPRDGGHYRSEYWLGACRYPAERIQSGAVASVAGRSRVDRIVMTMACVNATAVFMPKLDGPAPEISDNFRQCPA